MLSCNFSQDLNLIDQNDQIAATASAWFKEENGRRFPLVHWVSVSPNVQGKGLGSAIVKYVLSLFQDLEPDGKEVFLHTQTWSHKAIYMYYKYGFRITKTPLLDAKTDFRYQKVLEGILPDQLSSLWLIMRKNIILPQEQKESVVHLRMQKILHFIEKHFSEDITLSDLSASANISKSECSRCFKISMGTTPYKYLTEYRLSKAAQLLVKTNEPVGNIAVAVGFHQMSHFGKCFKEKTGYSPKEYRKMEKRKTITKPINQN